VVAVRREPFDLDRFVAALLALALGDLEGEKRTKEAGDERPVEQSSGR
jgi:hypothetical protein